VSEFLGEARVLIRPDTARFRTDLQEQVNRAISQAQIRPLAIPVALGSLGTGLSGVAAAQQEIQRTATGLASTEAVLNSRFAEQAVILRSL
jgi:hypothetical protein